MSEKFNTYGDTQQVRWSRIHAKECDSISQQLYPFIEQITNNCLERTLALTVEEYIKSTSTSLGVKTEKLGLESKMLGSQKKLNKSKQLRINLQEKVTQINHSFWLLGTMARSMDESVKQPDEVILYDFENEEIPPKILLAFQFRIPDQFFQLLGTTRAKHYKMIMESIRDSQENIRIWSTEISFQYSENKIILQSPLHRGKILGITHKSGEKIEGILAREPRKDRKYESLDVFNNTHTGSRVINLFD